MILILLLWFTTVPKSHSFVLTPHCMTTTLTFNHGDEIFQVTVITDSMYLECWEVEVWFYMVFLYLRTYKGPVPKCRRNKYPRVSFSSGLQVVSTSICL